jgi:hypothetical protein
MKRRKEVGEGAEEGEKTASKRSRRRVTAVATSASSAHLLDDGEEEEGSKQAPASLLRSVNAAAADDAIGTPLPTVSSSDAILPVRAVGGLQRTSGFESDAQTDDFNDDFVEEDAENRRQMIKVCCLLCAFRLVHGSFCSALRHSHSSRLPLPFCRT